MFQLPHSDSFVYGAGYPSWYGIGDHLSTVHGYGNLISFGIERFEFDVDFGTSVKTYENIPLNKTK